MYGYTHFLTVLRSTINVHYPNHHFFPSFKESICLCYALKDATNKIDPDPQPYSEKPLFYVDRGKYESHVVRALTSIGWRRLVHCAKCEKDHGLKWREEDVIPLLQLAWVRNRGGFPYLMLKGLNKMWNHIPNEFCLTKKHYLAIHLRQYITTHQDQIPNAFHEIHPETFFLNDTVEKECFLKALAQSEAKRSHLLKCNSNLPIDNSTLWIIKPVDSSGGKGIHVIDSLQSFIERQEETILVANRPSSFIAQRYIASPLLLNGHKFDIRAYMYIANVEPPLVFYHDGYLRVNIEPYDTNNLGNVWSHISNIGLQRLHAKYEENKEASKWSFKTWQKYMLDHVVDDPNWIQNHIKPQLMKIMEISYHSVMYKLKRFQGYGSFALLGVDFLVDCNMKAWLLEYTKTPAGHSTLEKDDTLFTDMMDELLAIQTTLPKIPYSQTSQYPTDLKIDPVKNFVRIV